MLQVSKLLAQGAGLSPAILKRSPSIELDWDVRTYRTWNDYGGMFTQLLRVA